MHPDFGTNVQGPAQWPRMYDGLCPTKSKSNLPIHTHRFAHYCKIPLTQGKFAKVDPTTTPGSLNSAGTPKSTSTPHTPTIAPHGSIIRTLPY